MKWKNENRGEAHDTQIFTISERTNSGSNSPDYVMVMNSLRSHNITSAERASVQNGLEAAWTRLRAKQKQDAELRVGRFVDANEEKSEC